MKDGVYNYNGKQLQLDINHKNENNAIHGFIYNKEFEVVDSKTSKSEALITLQYEETQLTKGFPYTYKVQLVYTLSKNGLTLTVVIMNTDSKTFPFTIGWHPYFISEDLYHSTVKFDCTKKVVLGDRMITTGTDDYLNQDHLQIEGKKLDDCFILNSDKIHFRTPAYDLEIASSSKDTYLQLYTPPKENVIAIEPTTGISDSFNNNIGLQTLEPESSYTVKWDLILERKS
ncbi:aldose 1-epimerase [Nonlabens tegetincola]|uniref:aldose 1-epimerase n=1 Tax=Nonlabens tegetincola TaxID=323273 RepID=UPI0034E2A34A